MMGACSHEHYLEACSNHFASATMEKAVAVDARKARALCGSFFICRCVEGLHDARDSTVLVHVGCSGLLDSSNPIQENSGQARRSREKSDGAIGAREASSLDD